MFYALLIYGSESDWRRMARAQRERIMDSHIKAVQMENDAGALVAGFRLFPTDRATTVRATSDGITTVDGPFAETKEQFGGFQIVACKQRDDAVAYARQIVEHGGTVEVRPLNLDATSID
jgi:hypothetical protein